MKYLLVKALLGFGDRLQYLAMCVEYAIKMNLKLRVDWSDSTWSHGSETFQKYFSINLPTFELTDIPEDAVVYPEFWKGRLGDPLTNEIYETNKMENDRPKPNYDCDVLVLTSGGTRTIYRNINFFGNIFKVVDPRIIQEVRNRQQTYNLKEKWCIHLRGTDRFQTKAQREKRFLQLYLKMIHHGLLNNGSGCVIVSDDQEFIDLWRKRDKDSPVLSKPQPTKPGVGLHLRSQDLLDTTKDEMNVNMLIDFFTLSACKQVFSTSNDSRFSFMAQQLKPFVNQIL